jgi:hypothetical protein
MLVPAALLQSIAQYCGIHESGIIISVVVTSGKTLYWEVHMISYHLNVAVGQTVSAAVLEYHFNGAVGQSASAAVWEHHLGGLVGHR